MEFIYYNGNKDIIKIGKFSTSKTEIRHLLTALFMITLTLLVANRYLLSQYGFFNTVILFLCSVGLGFLLHELAHKFTAQYYGYISEFRADLSMMLLALFVSITGFVFLAPGAVLILGRPSIRKNGIISVAGPLTNLVLAILSFAIASTTFGFTKTVFLISFKVNTWLGLFNLLPIWILDGKKVLLWNKTVYFVLLGIFILLFLI